MDLSGRQSEYSQVAKGHGTQWISYVTPCPTLELPLSFGAFFLSVFRISSQSTFASLTRFYRIAHATHGNIAAHRSKRRSNDDPWQT